MPVQTVIKSSLDVVELCYNDRDVPVLEVMPIPMLAPYPADTDADGAPKMSSAHCSLLFPFPFGPASSRATASTSAAATPLTKAGCDSQTRIV